MKVYITADIEGVTGVTDWDEAGKKNADYGEFREQMTAEVAAACEAALAAGAGEVWVKDAHETGRNLLASKLPKQVRLIRGWSGHPFCMVQELDETFKAALMIGYHSRAGADTNPLAHTMGGTVSIKLNGRPVSEFLLHSWAAALVKVPVAFVAGDKGLCDEVRGTNPAIETVAVKEGIGKSTVSIHPSVATARIREAAEKALRGDVSRCLLKLPKSFALEVQFERHDRGYKASFYPGARLAGPGTVLFEAKDYFDVLRFMLFAL